MTSRYSWSVVILAAGLGKRMRSRQPKALHAVAGRPMALHVLAAARDAFATDEQPRFIAVVGHFADKVKTALGDGLLFAHQAEQLGTGHALAQAEPLAEGAEHVLVLNADIPLITAKAIAALTAAHLEHGADLTFLTARVDEAKGQGRVRRDAEGRVTGVVEEADADDATRAGTEVNVGVYCFRGEWLWPRLARIEKSAAGEYYLTDLIGMAAGDGSAVFALPVDDADEALGINDRVQLARADTLLRERIRRRHMLQGVTLIDPATIYIDANVAIGMDTTVHPNTSLLGDTHLGEECVIGPGTQIIDSRVGSRCRVSSSVIEGSTLEDDVEVGPFSHVRPGSYIGQGAHIGNFAEVKNARLGRNTRMGHFSYIGDALVGDDVNIGAGTITCNYDGVRKNQTIIGDGAFIGSDTMLIAPVEVGRGATTGAGSVVNHDVPPDTLAVGAPARVRRKKGKTSE
ncbi:MAG: bifunctional UDP-N-acetylglucosamine diphosphorylase/glucosamine-1-phosphate N-acetyltransferase GlmU [Dehalococcoidia bacterium]|jgi:bifunctional UDP-N-acetylglucosamine pyrophosphorylase/glucosamine-1-phosphate N-acetyltransferase